MAEDKEISIDGDIGKKNDLNWWQKKKKRQKITFVVTMVILALSVGFLISLLFSRELYGDEFANSVYGKDPDGNYFYSSFDAIRYHFKQASLSIWASVLSVLITFIITFFIDFLVKLFTINGSKRVKTTGSLIRSLLKYLAVLICAAILLTLWGVDIMGIVASIGVLTLIIGLGCQSLISDIISGLFIVFDDYFSVGDMVIIDGFRGYIAEIGLRAVKIDDNCGNIKSINNSSISSCVNLSRQPNYISITMPASYNEDVERLEAVFAKELPHIKERMPQIIDGPHYKGIDSFGSKGIAFCFAFTTKAEYRFQATRDFKREIYQMYVKNNIIVPFDQIVVNPPDPKDRPKASDEDKKESDAVNRKNRAKKTPAKKVTLSQKLAKAYDDAIKDVKDEIKR